MRHHKPKNPLAVANRQNSFHKIAQSAADQQRQHERPQRNLKHPVGQHENLEWKWRRQDAGNEGAEKCVTLHPEFGSLRALPRAALKKYLAAFLGQKIEPNAACQGADRSHPAVVRHACRALDRKLDHQRVRHERKRKDRRIEECDEENSAAAHHRHDFLQPMRQLHLVHLSRKLRRSRPIVAEFSFPARRHENRKIARSRSVR
jgi:hypothetical protein